MARMTNKQIEHALERLNSITRKLTGSPPEEPKKKSVKQMVQALHDGTTTLNIREIVERAVLAYFRQNENASRWETVDFEKVLRDEVFAPEYNKAMAEYEALSTEYEARHAKILAEARRVEDEIVLGDAQEALQLLTAFAQFKES